MPVIVSLVFKAPFLNAVTFIYLYSASEQLGFVILFADYPCKVFIFVYFEL